MNDFQFCFQLFSLRKCDISYIIRNFGTKKILTECDLNEFCSELLLNEEDLAKREIIRCFFEQIFRSKSLNCKVYSFGSTTSGIGTYDSDIDFHVRLLDPTTNQPIIVEVKDSKKYLKQMCQIFRSTIQSFYYPMFINAKNCPIVKLNIRNQNSNPLVNCDLNVTNPFGIYNSIFINLLCQFSPRFHHLAAILRHWAKLNNMICASGMNSYTFTILVIFFLQNCAPTPIFLPIECLDLDFKQYYYTSDPEDFKNLLYFKCSNIVLDNENKVSTFELISQFFQFYASFDYMNYIICPRLGTAIRKDRFEQIIFANKKKTYSFPMTSGLCIEDPFELERNISKSVYFFKLDEFITLCNRFESKDERWFKNGSNFKYFISQKSNIENSKVISRIVPCICFLNAFFKVSSDFTSNLEQTHRLIDDYAQSFFYKFVNLFKSNEPIKCEQFRVRLLDYTFLSEQTYDKNNISLADFVFSVEFKQSAKKVKQSQHSNTNLTQKKDIQTPAASATSTGDAKSKTSTQIVPQPSTSSAKSTHLVPQSSKSIKSTSTKPQPSTSTQSVPIQPQPSTSTGQPKYVNKTVNPINKATNLTKSVNKSKLESKATNATEPPKSKKLKANTPPKTEIPIPPVNTAANTNVKTEANKISNKQNTKLKANGAAKDVNNKLKDLNINSNQSDMAVPSTSNAPGSSKLTAPPATVSKAASQNMKTAAKQTSKMLNKKLKTNGLSEDVKSQLQELDINSNQANIAVPSTSTAPGPSQSNVLTSTGKKKKGKARQMTERNSGLASGNNQNQPNVVTQEIKTSMVCVFRSEHFFFFTFRRDKTNPQFINSLSHYVQRVNCTCGNKK